MSTTTSPASRRAAVGWACGSAERAPPATMVSKLGFSAPSRRMRYSSSAARSGSFMPGRTRAAACSKARELVSTERRMRAISSADFTMRSSSIQPRTGSSEAFIGSLDSQRLERLAAHPRRLVADAAQARARRMAASTSTTSGPCAIFTWHATSCAAWIW